MPIPPNDVTNPVEPPPLQVEITPTQVLSQTVTTLRVIGAWINRFGSEGSANVHWVLYDKYNNQVDAGAVLAEGPDYDSWGADDTYVLNFVLSKLGLTAKNLYNLFDPRSHCPTGSPRSNYEYPTGIVTLYHGDNAQVPNA